MMWSLEKHRLPLKMLRLLAALAGCSLSSPTLAEALEVRGDRLFVPVEVQGLPVEALLDSGAELSIADTGFAATARLGGGDEVTARGTGAGEVPARLIDGVGISVAGRDLTATVAVIDLSDVSARLIGGQLDFVLGRTFFDAGRWILDIAGRQLLPARGQPGGVKLELETAKGLETIPVDVNGIPARADFDLGNGSDVRVSAELAERLGLKPVGMEPAGGIGGAALTPVVFIPSMTIAGRTFHKVRAHLAPDDPQGPALNVGVKLLRAFRLTIDYPAKAIWFESIGG